jgi:hypothetical protein
MTLEPIDRAVGFENRELQTRLESAPRSSVTQTMRIVDGSTELAFVVLDLWDDSPAVVLYELYVPSAQRGAGVGTTALRLVEQLALSLGRSRVDLRVHSLEPNVSDDELTNWYLNRGYGLSPDGSGLYSKSVTN